jgi:hypothetical protein
MSDKFKRLLRGNICGIVDGYGAVHSVFTDDRVDFHASHFVLVRCRWRWNHDKGIWWIGECRPTEEEYAAIQNHLTRVYGLKWWENGHHDIGHLLKKAGKEL